MALCVLHGALPEASETRAASGATILRATDAEKVLPGSVVGRRACERAAQEA
jgi:hypothetical protein